MKVRDLMQRLQALDQNLDVVCYCEDEALIHKNDRTFLLFEILDIATPEAHPVTLRDGTPYLNFESGAPKIVTLDVTSAF